jgi:hypothetical protein
LRAQWKTATYSKGCSTSMPAITNDQSRCQKDIDVK